jgi:hypothetical protein
VESVAPTIVATEIRVRNAVAVITAALIPSAVVGLPVACPMSLPSGTLHLLLLRRGPLLPGLHLLDRLLLLPVLGLLLSTLLLLFVLSLLLLLSPLLLLLLRSLPGLLLRLGTLLLGLGTLLLGLGTLLLLRSLPGLLLGLGTLLLGLSTLLLGLSLLGGWDLLGRLGLLLLLLLMLCACRNCDPKNQEQECSADDSDSLHSVLLN